MTYNNQRVTIKSYFDIFYAKNSYVEYCWENVCQYAQIFICECFSKMMEGITKLKYSIILRGEIWKKNLANKIILENFQKTFI